MSELNVTEVRDMAYDLYKGRTANFDAESANEAIKNIEKILNEELVLN